MDVELSSIIARARELHEAGNLDDTWRVIEPIADQARSNPEVALLWLAVCEQDGEDARSVRVAEIAGAFGGDLDFVLAAADVLVQSAELRPFDEDPPPHGAARIAVDLLRSVQHKVAGVAREQRVDYFSELAMALRMTGSQDDAAALEAMQQAIDLEPSNADSWFKLGLLYKWRGRWAEGIDANRRAIKLGADGTGVRWNLAICATGAGDLETAIATSEELNVHVSRGDDGLPFGRFGSVQVRISSLGQGIDARSHVIGNKPTFENVWIERRSICHGAIVSATYYNLCADYGDVVLFDGAPVGYRVDGDSRTPRFPLLQKLRDGAYRRFPFAAVQPKAAAVAGLEPRFPHGTRFYVHDEQVTWMCEACARNEDARHDHARESLIVTGKLILPPDAGMVEVANELDRVNAEADGIRIASPALLEAIADARREAAARSAFDEIIARREAEAQRFVQCTTHGRREATYVCKHVATGDQLGFFTSDSGEPRPDAWCAACERVRLEQGGPWNEVSEAYAEITMLCSDCYDAAKERNIIVRAAPPSPPPARKRWWKFWK